MYIVTVKSEDSNPVAVLTNLRKLKVVLEMLWESHSPLKCNSVRGQDDLPSYCDLVKLFKDRKKLGYISKSYILDDGEVSTVSTVVNVTYMEQTNALYS